MKAQVETREDVVVVSISGCLNYEALDAFRLHCKQLVTGKRVVVNLDGLNFVGSSGITDFVDTLIDMRQTAAGQLELCGVGSEFRRIFSSSPLSTVTVHASQSEALTALATRLTAAGSQVPQDFIEDQEQ